MFETDPYFTLRRRVRKRPSVNGGAVSGGALSARATRYLINPWYGAIKDIKDAIAKRKSKKRQAAIVKKYGVNKVYNTIIKVLGKW